jgi:hypothetical protein
VEDTAETVVEVVEENREEQLLHVAVGYEMDVERPTVLHVSAVFGHVDG